MLLLSPSETQLASLNIPALLHNQISLQTDYEVGDKRDISCHTFSSHLIGWLVLHCGRLGGIQTGSN